MDPAFQGSATDSFYFLISNEIRKIRSNEKNESEKNCKHYITCQRGHRLISFLAFKQSNHICREIIFLGQKTFKIEKISGHSRILFYLCIWAHLVGEFLIKLNLGISFFVTNSKFSSGPNKSKQTRILNMASLWWKFFSSTKSKQTISNASLGQVQI